MARPYTICHMCTTIDGKIVSDRWPKLPGGKTGSSLFESTAASFKIAAWIVGTTTMREFSGKDFKLKASKVKVPTGDHIAKAQAKSLAIGLDAKASLRFKKNDVEGDHIVVCLTQKATSNYRAHLIEAGVSYIVCGKRKIDLTIALQKIHKFFKIKKLMIEGGGKFNGSMLQAGLVDEISQVIIPVVDGGSGVSSIFDVTAGNLRKAVAKLQFKSHKRLNGGVNWSQYRVLHD